jgi:hypothetical protein
LASQLLCPSEKKVSNEQRPTPAPQHQNTTEGHTDDDLLASVSRMCSSASVIRQV